MELLRHNIANVNENSVELRSKWVETLNGVLDAISAIWLLLISASHGLKDQTGYDEISRFLARIPPKGDYGAYLVNFNVPGKYLTVGFVPIDPKEILKLLKGRVFDDEVDEIAVKKAQELFGVDNE